VTFQLKLTAPRADGDERTGLKILERALEAPTRTIADNSGYDDGVVVERMRTGTGNQGFDAARGCTATWSRRRCSPIG
jgi:chaperonin GroEL (HSP60 family)